MDEKFNPENPDEAWCSDITYIWTFEGFVYLTNVMVLFSRKIIAWVLSDTLEAKWVIEAIEKAKAARQVKKPCFLLKKSNCPSTQKEGYILIVLLLCLNT